jgi:hypothetical protein
MSDLKEDLEFRLTVLRPQPGNILVLEMEEHCSEKIEQFAKSLRGIENMPNIPVIFLEKGQSLYDLVGKDAQALVEYYRKKGT